MATTLSLVRFSDNKVDIGHVGDSRIYHVRNKGLVTRTDDQTEVAELVKQGVFTKEEALRYPRRNVLLSSLSAQRDFVLFESSFEVNDDDAIVLCTDGFYNSVPKVVIVECLLQHTNITDNIRDLENIARTVGPSDDATALLIRI